MGKKAKRGTASGGVNSPAQTPGAAGADASFASPQKTDQSSTEQSSVASPSMDLKATSEKIDHALQRRKSFEEVHDAGILKTAEDVEKLSEIAEKVADKLESRPDQDEMLKAHEHILNPSGANRRLSGTLASTAKDLEKHMTADKIDRHLSSRPDVESLEKNNLLASPTVAPQLQGVQKQLQRKLSADELSHRLDSRPDVQELRDHGIVLNDGVAPSLQATQEKLQRQIHADKVSQQLSKRPSLTEMVSNGVFDKADVQIAPGLTATAKKLERNLVQNQVSHLLESRPEKNDLVTHNIIEDPDATVAPMLQGAKHQLERQLKADTIARQLRKRPSISELEEKGIISEGEMADSLSKKISLSQRARYTLALKAAGRIAADKLISEDEKSRLKDLILSDDEKVVAALECYELDEDIEELLDTLYRVAKVA